MTTRSRPEPRVARPPYGPTAGMLQGLQLLQKGNVTRVDEELLRANNVAPGNEYKVVGALRYLGVIDEAGRPTERSRSLRTRGPTFSLALQEMIQTAYRPILEGVDLRSADRDELYNAFVTRADLGPEMAQKATRFLLGICTLAGMELSPAFAGSGRTRATPAATPHRRREPAATRAASLGPAAPPAAEPAPPQGGTVFNFEPPPREPERPFAPALSSAAAPAGISFGGAPLILAITPQTAELSEDELTRLFRKLFSAVRRAQAELDAGGPTERKDGR